MATVACSWVVGYGGAVSGAAIGSAILPGIGTIFGGLLGALVGGIGGSVAAKKAIEIVGDKVDYDMVNVVCSICKFKFKARKYLNEPVDCCQECLSRLIEYFQYNLIYEYGKNVREGKKVSLSLEPVALDAIEK